MGAKTDVGGDLSAEKQTAAPTDEGCQAMETPDSKPGPPNVEVMPESSDESSTEESGSSQDRLTPEETIVDKSQPLAGERTAKPASDHPLEKSKVPQAELLPKPSPNYPVQKSPIFDFGVKLTESGGGVTAGPPANNNIFGFKAPPK